MNPIEALAIFLGVIAWCVLWQCAIYLRARARARHLNRFYRRTRKALNRDEA